jgi:hypothetical protein
LKHSFVLVFLLSGVSLAQVCSPTGVAQPNSRITAALDASACTLADGTWFADYLLTLSSGGTWSASVAAGDGSTTFSLILRDPSGARIDSGSTIKHYLERGTYHVLVNGSAPNQGGAYTVTSSFSAAANVLCRQFPMMGTLRSVNGQIGSGSCQLPDGSAYDGFQLTLFGTGTVDIAVSAPGVSPLLILRTADGEAVGSSSVPDDSGVVHLTVPGVGSDTYTVVITVSDPTQAGGSYSLSASFTPDPDETCVSAAALNGSQLYNGTIDAGSCNFNLPGRDDFSPFNYHTTHLDSGGIVQASLDSVDFSPLILLLDADGNPIAEDVDSGGAGAPLIRQQLPAGDYRLLLYNEDSFGGSYTLNYQFAPGPAPACPVTNIDAGNQATGILSGASSCKDGGFLSDVYTVVLPADGTVSLALTSPDFSTFLDLHDAKDNDLTWGAQNSDGSASSLTVDLPAGTYLVDAASMDLPGGYILSYTFTPKTLTVCPAARQMPPNGFIHNVQLNDASCQEGDGRKADFYRFTLPAASTEAAFMTSDSLPPDLTLYAQDGTPLRSDQNSYAGNNAMIVQYLPAGTYMLRARSADPTVQGVYNLDLLFTQGGPPQLCAARNVAVPGRANGATSITSCAWSDKTFVDLYKFNVADSTQIITLSAQSAAFDAFLVLMDAKGNVLATDDNSGGGLNPLIVQTLDPGSYYVAVKPANDPTSAGVYILTTSSVAAPVPQHRQP